LGILLGVVLYQLMLINFYISMYLSFVSLVHMHWKFYVLLVLSLMNLTQLIFGLIYIRLLYG